LGGGSQDAIGGILVQGQLPGEQSDLMGDGSFPRTSGCLRQPTDKSIEFSL
jgi:hypothetical protein